MLHYSAVLCDLQAFIVHRGVSRFWEYRGLSSDALMQPNSLDTLSISLSEYYILFHSISAPISSLFMILEQNVYWSSLSQKHFSL